MLKQTEGSRAVAGAVAMCRPQVICAYPITPQTHIVEALSARRSRRPPTATSRGSGCGRKIFLPNGLGHPPRPP
jgi:Pyruvate flavodoxin/ferredoxin oxidoreductase, thiamine diP-bdg